MAPRAKLQRQPKAGSYVGFELHAELIEESAVGIQLCHEVFVLTGKELEIVSRKRLGKLVWRIRNSPHLGAGP
jgi:hypothetical protein